MPKISIIIPVYNTEEYLSRCLDSVCNQTLSDIEIICIDANSEDNSLAILKKYALKDNRIKIHESKEHLTAGKARNIGIDIASGEYIGFIDSDDYIDLDFYEKLYKKALETNADIAKSNLKYVNWKTANENTVYYNLAQVRESKLKFNHVPTALIKKSLLNENNIKYPQDLTCAEDSVFEVMLSIKTNKIEIEDSVAYYYCYRDLSLNHTDFVTLEKIKEIEKSILKIIEIFNNSDLSEKDYIAGIYDRYFYLTTFIRNKATSFEVREYIQQTENNFKKLIKYKEAFEPILLKTRIERLLAKQHMLDKLKQQGINKKELDIEISNFNKIGITKEKRTPRFIVSLTSFPQRMYDIHYCLYSLLNQTFKPDEVILWLAFEQFPNLEKDVPQKVLDLQKNGLTIKFTNDTKSYKKLIPALKEYPNDVIITADDDIFYQNDWLEKLYNAYLEDKENILCHRAHKIKFKDNDNIAQYRNWDKKIDDNSCTCLNLATGCGGILYPVNAFYKDILNEKLFKKLAPNADDIWFWAMAVLNNRKIRVIKDPQVNPKPINLKRERGFINEITLFQTNITENDIQLKNVLNKYPKILEKLKTELNKDLINA